MKLWLLASLGGCGTEVAEAGGLSDSAIDSGSAIDSSRVSGPLKVEFPEFCNIPALLGLQLEIRWSGSRSPEVPSPPRADSSSFALGLAGDNPNGER